MSQPIPSYVHAEWMCDPPCPFHAPSDHHMVEWPWLIRESALVERTCEHGIGHPDSDSYAWMEEVYPQDGAWGVHGCDGCCHEPDA